MDNRRWLMAGLVLLVVIALVSAIGGSIQRSAWNEGYLVGRLSANAQGGSTAPIDPYLYQYQGGGWGHAGFPGFGCFGFLLFLGLLFFLFIGPGRYFLWRAWRQGEGRGGPHFGHHGHRPPWWGEEESPPTSARQGPGPQDPSAGGGTASV
jgi:hypothetical protein